MFASTYSGLVYRNRKSGTTVLPAIRSTAWKIPVNFLVRQQFRARPLRTHATSMSSWFFKQGVGHESERKTTVTRCSRENPCVVGRAFRLGAGTCQELQQTQLPLRKINCSRTPSGSSGNNCGFFNADICRRGKLSAWGCRCRQWSRELKCQGGGSAAGLGFGFWILNFGFWNLGFGFRV